MKKIILSLLFLIPLISISSYGQELSKKEVKKLKKELNRNYEQYRISYDIIKDKYCHGPISVKKGSSWGFVDSKSLSVTIPIKYDEVRSLSEYSVFAAKKGKFWALINYDTGKNVTDFRYENLHANFNGVRGAKKNGKWGYIDDDGNIVIEFIFDKISAFDNYGISNGVEVIHNGQQKKMFIDSRTGKIRFRRY